MQDCIGFTLLCSVIGKLASSSQLIKCKLETIATRSFAFSRASNSLLVFTPSSHWLMSVKVFSDWSLGLLLFGFMSLN